MAQLPILPLKVDALLGDTNHLTAEEFGAYCRVLFTMWRHEAQLRDDPDELARIAGVSRKRWDAIGERVMRSTLRAGGIVTQKRLTATWLEVQSIRRKRAAASEQRWSKRKPGANVMQMHSTSNAIQNQRRNITLPEQEAAHAFLEKARAAARATRKPDD